MDLNQLNQQMNDALNRWIQATSSYFSTLSQNEMYGWGAFTVGLILFVAGLILYL